MFQAAFELAGGAEDIDKAEAFAGYVVMAVQHSAWRTPRQASANILDIEWGIALWISRRQNFLQRKSHDALPMVIGRQYRLENSCRRFRCDRCEKFAT